MVDSSAKPPLTGSKHMLSELTEAMIVNGVVLATVLASDLNPCN